MRIGLLALAVLAPVFVPLPLLAATLTMAAILAGVATAQAPAAARPGAARTGHLGPDPVRLGAPRRRVSDRRPGAAFAGA